MEDSTVLHSLGYPEALRWRDRALWFSDMFRSRVMLHAVQRLRRAVGGEMSVGSRWRLVARR